MKRVKLITAALLLVIIIILVFGFFDKSKPIPNDKASQLVLKQTKNLVVIDKRFKSIDNLIGFLVHFKKSPNEKAIIYADKQGRYLIMGHIIAADGVNITQKEAERYIHDPQMDNAYEDVQKTHWVLQGKADAKHVLTVLIDPNNPLFPEQYENLESMVAEGTVAIHWVLVNYLKPSGAGTAAAILSAHDPQKALQINAENYDQQTQTGGMPALSMVTPMLQKKLDDNWNFMQRYKFNSTPISFFKTDDGRIHVIQGFLFDEMLESVLADAQTSED